MAKLKKTKSSSVRKPESRHHTAELFDHFEEIEPMRYQSRYTGTMAISQRRGYGKARKPK